MAHAHSGREKKTDINHHANEHGRIATTVLYTLIGIDGRIKGRGVCRQLTNH